MNHGVRRADRVRLIFWARHSVCASARPAGSRRACLKKDYDQTGCSAGRSGASAQGLRTARDCHRFRSASPVSRTSAGVESAGALAGVDRQFCFRYSAQRRNAASHFAFGETRIACGVNARELPQYLCMMASSRDGPAGISPSQPVRRRTDSHEPKSNVFSSLHRAHFL